jgi:hypothetical protein
MVLLQYRSTSTEVPLSDLQALADTGEISPALDAYFQTIELTPEEAQRILSAVIYDEGIPINNTNAKFVALQLSQSIGDVWRRERQEDMFTALRASFEDDRQISMIEIIENYPDSITRVSLNRLGRLQSDLTLFIERIEPILRVVQQLLPELVCDCVLEGETLPEATNPDEAQMVATDAWLNTTHETASKDVTACIGTMRAEKRAIYDRAIAQLKGIVNDAQGAPPGMPRNVAFMTEQASLSALGPFAQSQPEPLVPLSLNNRSRLPDPVVKDIIISFGPFRPSFNVEAMEEFIKTGNLPNGWRFYLSVAGLSSEEFRTALTEEVNVDSAFMDDLLNNILGEYLLFQVGTVIHTPSRGANIQALRSALILSAIDDGKVSLFEFIQRYPASQIIIEGLNLARFGSNLSRQGVVGTTTAGLEDMLLELQAGVADDVCNCVEEQPENP